MRVCKPTEPPHSSTCASARQASKISSGGQRVALTPRQPPICPPPSPSAQLAAQRGGAERASGSYGVDHPAYYASLRCRTSPHVPLSRPFHLRAHAARRAVEDAQRDFARTTDQYPPPQRKQNSHLSLPPFPPPTTPQHYTTTTTTTTQHPHLVAQCKIQTNDHTQTPNPAARCMCLVPKQMIFPTQSKLISPWIRQLIH